MTNDYEGTKTDEQRHWEAFPGVRGLYSDEVLEQPSVEQVRSSADAMLAEIRDEITARFGYTWVRTTDEVLRPERNGYGGESLLVEFQSTGWATAEPIRDESRKREVLAVIDDVVSRYDFTGMVGFNEPSSGLDPSMLEKLYGSADPALQPRWQWYSRQYYPDVMRFYAEITDLSLDSTGQFTAARQGQTADTGAPLEGLEIVVVAEDLLSEADRAEFEERMRDFPGY